MVLGCVHCLKTADPVLAWNVPDVGKTSVTFNFLTTTPAPVFVPVDPKFLARESTQPIQGGPALLNSWEVNDILEGKASDTVGNIYP